MLSAGSNLNDRREGFTLIELVVVMLIISLMAFLAVPVLSRSFDGMKMDGSIRKITAMARRGRSEAMARQIPVRMVMDMDSGQYWIEEVSGEEASEGVAGSKAAGRLPSGLAIRAFAMPDGVVVEGSIIRVRFDPNGSSSGGTIYLSKADGNVSWEIFIEPFTGLSSLVRRGYDKG